MGNLHIRNWERWQSYRVDRGQPPWIKVHRCLMRNPDWVILTDAQRGQLICLWLLAADRNGEIPSDPSLLRKLCFMEQEPDLQLFQDKGFVDVASSWRQVGVNVASGWRQHDAPEAEAEAETKADTKAETEADISAEASSETSAPEPCFIELPVLNGKEFRVSVKLVAEYSRSYPAVNVEYELGKMRSWLISNPKKGKTSKGILRFVNTWLARCQDDGGSRVPCAVVEQKPILPPIDAHKIKRQQIEEKLRKKGYRETDEFWIESLQKEGLA